MHSSTAHRSASASSISPTSPKKKSLRKGAHDGLGVEARAAAHPPPRVQKRGRRLDAPRTMRRAMRTEGIPRPPFLASTANKAAPARPAVRYQRLDGPLHTDYAVLPAHFAKGGGPRRGLPCLVRASPASPAS